MKTVATILLAVSVAGSAFAQGYNNGSNSSTSLTGTQQWSTNTTRLTNPIEGSASSGMSFQGFGGGASASVNSNGNSFGRTSMSPTGVESYANHGAAVNGSSSQGASFGFVGNTASATQGSVGLSSKTQTGTNVQDITVSQQWQNFGFGQ